MGAVTAYFIEGIVVMITSTFLYIEMNFFAIIILLILIRNNSYSKRRYNVDFDIFKLLAYTRTILLLFEMVMRIEMVRLKTT